VDAEVKIIQKFQEAVPLIGSILLHEFRLQLVDEDIRSMRESSDNLTNNKYHRQINDRFLNNMTG